jgi:hypothetical protein
MTEPARWRLSDGPPGDGSGPDPEPAEDAEASPVHSELIDRSDRAAIAEFLATVASADPEADPLAGADERGGHALGCDPEAPHA